jgi:hypothetical protein
LIWHKTWKELAYMKKSILSFIKVNPRRATSHEKEVAALAGSAATSASSKLRPTPREKVALGCSNAGND